MVNITFLFDKELDTKEAARALLQIVENLPKNWKVNMPSFYRTRPPLNREFYFESMPDNPIFSKNFSDGEIKEAEKKLNYSFPLLLNSYYDYKWKCKQRKKYPQFMAQLVHYWTDYFSRIKTDIFFSTYECNYPHSVAYIVARNLGIPIIHIAISRFGDGIIFLDNDLLPIFYKKITPSEIEKYFKEVHTRLTEKKNPVRMELASRHGGFYFPKFSLYWRHWKKYKSETELYRLTRASLYVKLKRYLTKNTRRLILPRFYQKADLDKNFFLYTLSHFREATNSLHYNMVDQYDLAKMISRALPSGYYLYIKPHPHYNCSDVVMGKMLELRKLKNIRFIPAQTNLFQLLQKSKGLITLGAFTGVEAIIANKPIIAFGDPFFARPGTVISVTNPMDLPNVLTNIIKNPGYMISTQKRKAIISRYYAHQIALKEKPLSLPDLSFADDAEAKVVAAALVSAYEHIQNNKTKN